MLGRRHKRGEEALIAIIGDEDTVNGFLLAGIGENRPQTGANFLIVDANTPHTDVEDMFKKMTSRRDIGIVLINQHIADSIRYLLDQYDQIIPAILEIPSREIPYDPSKDYILTRVKQFLGQ